MLVEDQLRSELSSATEVVPYGPDLATSLRAGRRLRRRRAAATVTAATLAVGSIAVAGTVIPWSGQQPGGRFDDATTVERPAAPDYVAGTQLDETMQRVFTEYVPMVGQADDVYPSDWTRNGALPDSDFANATDWQARFSLGAHEEVLLVMGFPSPHEESFAGCEGQDLVGAQGAPGCRETRVGDGTVTTTGYSMQVPAADGLDTYTFLASYRSADGFTVNALDRVRAGSWRAADSMRVLDDATLAQLVVDPALTFPEPTRWPN